jgi:hypothetical protein
MIVGSDCLYNVFHPEPLLSETGLKSTNFKTCSISAGVKLSLEGVLKHESYYDMMPRARLETAVEKHL